MKELTNKEFLKAPAEIQYLHIMAVSGKPVGSQLLEGAMEKYPEYFQEELERKRKWALIPHNVHEDYQKELKTLCDEIYKDAPPSKGILGWARDPEGYETWHNEIKKYRELEKPLVDALYKKFYGQYGV